MTTKKTSTSTAVLTTETIDGVPIVFREDGYINLTKISAHYGKRPAALLRAPGVDEYLTALAGVLNVQKSHIWVSRKGIGGGTWLHPKMAVFVMRWLDVPFSVRADLLIDNILRGNVVATAVVRTQEAEEVTAQFAAMQTRILGLEEPVS